MASQPLPLLLNYQDIQLTWKADRTTKTTCFKPESTSTTLPSLKMNQTNNQFITRVRPAISRGKNAILATDPEKHVQLERERLALYEQRNRPKSPVNLIPIAVKAIGPHQSKNTPLKSKQNARTILHHVQKQNSVLKWWQTASANFSPNKDLPSILFKPVNENWIPSQTLQPYTHYYSTTQPEKISRSHTFEQEYRQPKPPRKFPPRYGNYIATNRNSDNQHFILTAKQCAGYSDDVTNTIEKVHNLNNGTCCVGDDTRSESAHNLPTIVTNRSPNSEVFSTQSCSPTIKVSNDGRTQLVVQLPSINYIPVASPITLSETPRQTLNKEKVDKLKELRKRELTELFTDIQELNAYNDTLTQSLVKTQGLHFHTDFEDENSVLLE